MRLPAFSFPSREQSWKFRKAIFLVYEKRRSQKGHEKIDSPKNFNTLNRFTQSSERVFILI